MSCVYICTYVPSLILLNKVLKFSDMERKKIKEKEKEKEEEEDEPQALDPPLD